MMDIVIISNKHACNSCMLFERFEMTGHSPTHLFLDRVDLVEVSARHVQAPPLAPTLLVKSYDKNVTSDESLSAVSKQIQRENPRYSMTQFEDFKQCFQDHFEKFLILQVLSSFQ